MWSRNWKYLRNPDVPDGIFKTIIGKSSVAEMLIDTPDASAITFTGSVSVGTKVA